VVAQQGKERLGLILYFQALLPQAVAVAAVTLLAMV
jgi:hypothetical protein